jgi:hypothetical protein
VTSSGPGEREAEIRRRLEMAKAASANAPGTFWHTFVENTEHLLKRNALLEGQLAKARELHRPRPRLKPATADHPGHCEHCGHEWPCPDAKALGLGKGDSDE